MSAPPSRSSRLAPRLALFIRGNLQKVAKAAQRAHFESERTQPAAQPMHAYLDRGVGRRLGAATEPIGKIIAAHHAACTSGKCLQKSKFTGRQIDRDTAQHHARL